MQGRSVWKSLRKNKGAVISLLVLCVVSLVALFAPFLAPFDPTEVHTDHFRLPPFWSEGSLSQYILGTDDLGRDLLSRLIYGARISLGVGFLVVVMASTIGAALGLVSGYFGGWVDSIIMRFVDVLMSLPSILLAIVVVAGLGSG